MHQDHIEPPGLPGMIDRSILAVGRFLSWANGLLVLVIVLQVTLRYGFRSGLVALEELEWHLYALAFMFGLSYDLVTNSHVRVDLLYNRFSERTREWIDLLGSLFLLLPFICVIIFYGLEFFYESWIHGESSLAAMGLPYRWVIKGVIPVSFAFLGLAALSRIIKAVQAICRT
jgi:TRAP-type mannitol/chloroaromatic compound transport system permease small subunit